MSWITDFAGKAEDFLNKIDHNAAAVLKKEKKKKKQNVQQLSHVETSEAHLTTNIYSPTVTTPKFTPKHSSLPEKIISTNNIVVEKEVEDKLMQFLNNSSYDIESFDSKLNGNHSVSCTSSTSDTTIISLPDEIVNDEEKLRSYSSNKETTLGNENEMLRNEIRSLNTEVTLLLARAKTAEKEMSQIKAHLSKKEMEASSIDKELTSVKHRLLKYEAENNELLAENERLKKMNRSKEKDECSLLKEAEARLSQCQLDAQQREEALKSDVATLRVRVTELEESLCESRKHHAAELSELGNRLSEARTELSDYMTKAASRIALKEKIVEELRTASNQDSSLSLDVQHLKSEVEWLTEECERLRNKSEAARLEAESAEKRLEEVREESAANISSLQSRLAQEHARRLAAEENCSVHNQELQSVREELTRQVMSMTERVRERETELTRLRRQLAQKGVNNQSTNNQEQRINALTKALVEKELSLEQMTDQRNQLRIQLDRIKSDYASSAYSSCGTRCLNVNDTDDAKAQVPLLMSEAPSDTPVTRRVKRAYTCVDSLGMRTGLFLRRYPLARLLLFVYIIFLHLWVCLVLFSSTPDTKT